MARLVRSIYVKEFRGIRRLSREVELRSFNVVIGRNNVGKSALLEALYLLPSPWSAQGDPLLGKPRTRFVAELHSGSTSSLVYGYSGSAMIRYMVGSTEDVILLSADGVVGSVIAGEEVESPDAYVKRLASVLGIGTEEVSRLTFLIPSSDGFIRALSDVLLSSHVWSSIVKSGVHRRVVRDLIDPVVHDLFTEVLIEGSRLKLRKEVSEDIGPLYIDTADLGDGVERLCLAALALEYLRPRLVLWDDIEASAHPGLIEALLRWLASRDWQVVISTHSLDVLFELLSIWPRNSGVIVLRKGRDDVVEHRVLELEDLEKMLSSGVDVRKVVDELEL